MRDNFDLTNNRSEVAIHVGVPALMLKLTTMATAQAGQPLTYQRVYSNTDALLTKNGVLKTTISQYAQSIHVSSLLICFPTEGS